MSDGDGDRSQKNPQKTTTSIPQAANSSNKKKKQVSGMAHRCGKINTPVHTIPSNFSFIGVVSLNLLENVFISVGNVTISTNKRQITV